MRIAVLTIALLVLGTVAWATRFEYIVTRDDTISVIRVNRYTGQAHAYARPNLWWPITDEAANQQAPPSTAHTRPHTGSGDSLWRDIPPLDSNDPFRDAFQDPAPQRR